MHAASEYLLNLVENPDPSSLGVSLDTVSQVQLKEEVTANVLHCLYDTEPLEVFWGLWFCEGLLMAGKLIAPLENVVIQQLPHFQRIEDDRPKKQALRMAVLLREKVPQYRDFMLEHLRDPDGTVRTIALSNCHTFLKQKEIGPLLRFKDDEFLEETSMGGPLVYVLRNEAFKKIEAALGVTVGKETCSIVLENGSLASWWDWRPLLDSIKRSQRWRFWRA